MLGLDTEIGTSALRLWVGAGSAALLIFFCGLAFRSQSRTTASATLRAGFVILAALFGLSVFLSWARFGRRIISLGSLALAAMYALWKIPLYARFLVARQVNWVRSKRD